VPGDGSGARDMRAHVSRTLAPPATGGGAFDDVRRDDGGPDPVSEAPPRVHPARISSPARAEFGGATRRETARNVRKRNRPKQIAPGGGGDEL
jgi:hypothetical protein